MIELVTDSLGVEPIIERHPMQPGDAGRIYAGVPWAKEMLGYAPTIPCEEGIPRFVEWFVAQERS